MKIVYIDVETTGLSIGKFSIWQLAYIIEIEGEVVLRQNCLMKPREYDELPDGYKVPVGEVTKADMAAFMSQAQAFELFKNNLDFYADRFNPKDKYHFAGYNAQAFDAKFIRQFFEDNGDTYFSARFYSACLDVMILAADKLKHQRHLLPNFKLETVCKFMGVEVGAGGFHDALADIEATKQLYEYLEFY